MIFTDLLARAQVQLLFYVRVAISFILTSSNKPSRFPISL